MRTTLAMTLALVSLATPSRAAGPEAAPLAIGAKAPDFSLPGVDGKTYSLKDFDRAKALVVAFTCNHCPTAQAYEARFARFAADYAPKGVAFVAISPNDPLAVRLDELGYTDLTDSFADMKTRAHDKAFPFPYLYDGETQKASRAFGVLATPHIYVFDADRALRYVGRFDDSEVKEVKSHDLANAVDAVLAGRKVEKETTRVVGCSTKWSDKRADAAKSLAKWDAEPVAIEPIDDAGLALLVKNDTKKFRLINVWATWCGPCVAELDDLVTINRMYRGRPFEVVTLSLDEAGKKDEALRVLTEHHASMKNGLIVSSDRDKAGDLIDKAWQGPVPYTMLVAPGGKVVYRHLGAFDFLDLKRAIVDQLGRTY